MRIDILATIAVSMTLLLVSATTVTLLPNAMTNTHTTTMMSANWK